VRRSRAAPGDGRAGTGRTIGALGLAYALGSAATAGVALAYFAGFLAGVVPRSVDTGPSVRWAQAVGRDVAVLALFGLQHSVMARSTVKRALARVVPPALERSTYVLLSALGLALVMWQWRPIPALVWRVDTPLGVLLMRALLVAGVLVVLAASRAIEAFGLLGLPQAYAAYRGERTPAARFVTPGPYRVVRHPIQAGTLVVLWATPVMTAGHLLLAGVFTVYVLIALRYEERDLVRAFGAEYAAYRERVPALVPRPGRRAR